MRRFLSFASLLGLAVQSGSDGLPQSNLLSESWGKEFSYSELINKDETTLKELFNDWKTYFGRTYSDLTEESSRYLIFLDNLMKIGLFNDEHSFTVRLNQFGDLTGDEFRVQVHGNSGACLRPDSKTLSSSSSSSASGSSSSSSSDDELILIKDESHKKVGNPSSVDWEAEGKVTPVKNQGSCGSCWAFSATGAIECNYAIQKGQLNSLSEQQLVDCTTSYGNYGCDGGWWYNAFYYVEQEGGLCSESEYPYTAQDGTCYDSSCGTKYDAISSQTRVSPDNENALETATASGCVSVGIEADQFAFQFYSGGVLTGTCGTTIDHGVLVVGYGTSSGQEYWKVKNSWGSSWGSYGYVYICKDCGQNGSEGECGINMYPYQPDI